MKKKILKPVKKVRKFEDGGSMAGKGPLQPTPKKEKSTEELANDTISKITTIPKTETSVSTSTPAPKAKLLPGGFKDQAQKDAYIKNTKNLLKKHTVADLVKMKHGTAAGLAALGFKDTKSNRAEIATPKQASKLNYNTKEAEELKTKGLKLKAKGRGMKFAGQVLKGLSEESKKSFAQKYNLPEPPKGLTKFMNATKDFVTPIEVVKNIALASNAVKLVGASRKALPVAKKLLPAAQKLLKTGQKTLPAGQKMLNSSKALLNPGQKMLSVGQKTLPAASKSSKIVSKIGGSRLKSTANVLKNTRANVTTKLSKGIKTTNPVARKLGVEAGKKDIIAKAFRSGKADMKNIIKAKRNSQTKLKLK